MLKSIVKVNTLNFETLNVHDCCEKSKQRNIIEDTFAYNLQVLGLTETHVRDGNCSTKITVKRDNKFNQTYQGFFSAIEGTYTFSGNNIGPYSSCKL